MNAYFISGLGADQRVFSKIDLKPDFRIVHLDWIPFSKNQSLKSYAEQLAGKIDTTKPFIVVGVSFGGMIATELAKFLNPEQTVIISSTIYSHQFPMPYKLAGKLNLLKLVPASFLKASNQLTQNYFFGIKSIEDKALLKQIVKDTDPTFLKWAIGAILKWENSIKPKNLIHIHGDQDKIFPIKRVEPDFIVSGGGHFMVYQNAPEISKILNNLIM